LNVLRANSFDDEMLEKALNDINEIWKKSPLAKCFFITSYGNLDLIIQCIKNLDESVMLNACKAAKTLLYGEEGA
jgi:hypothetical protein